MTDVPEPTLDLLSRLLGKRTAKRVYRGSLTDLFLDETVPEDVKAATPGVPRAGPALDAGGHASAAGPGQPADPSASTSPCTTRGRSARSSAVSFSTTAIGSSPSRKCSWAPSTVPRCIPARS